VRFSTGWATTEAEVDFAVDAVRAVAAAAAREPGAGAAGS